jgi:hypothetical protein
MPRDPIRVEFLGWFGLPNGQGAKASALITTLVYMLENADLAAIRAHALEHGWPLAEIDAELHERGLDV